MCAMNGFQSYWSQGGIIEGMTGNGNSNIRTPSIDTIDISQDRIDDLDLYQKYRPMTFDDVYGQSNTVEALRSYVKSYHETGKLPAAIILAGLHGSGKTTLAFILARALNCQHVDSRWNPCNECDSCRGIIMDENGSLPGFKYQAMSNLVNGIDDVRALIQQSYIRSSLKKPVFVLDEAQALSKSQGAWDCFLNPIESGTPTLFIFCTTEPSKIAKAVRSRCVKLSFGPISREDMMHLCVDILNNEGYTLRKEPSPGDNNRSDGKIVYKGQVMSAVDQGGGSARDTLTALSMIIESGMTQKSSTNSDLLDAVFSSRSRGQAIRILTEAESNGEQMDSIAAVFADSCGRMTALADGVPDGDGDGTAIIQLSRLYSADVYADAMTYVGQALSGMAWGAGDPRIYLEIAVMRIIGMLEAKRHASRKG